MDIKKPLVPSDLLALKNVKSKHSAVRSAKEAQKNRVSRRIEIAKKNEFCDVVCDITGTVSILNIPRIPGYVLEWTSPLASIDNCRGIVQRGTQYLESLDTQILSALLITIADDYSLFSYQPSYTGAQKNAILRSAGRITLINALLLIENFLHSHNVFAMPKLALLITQHTTAGEIESNLTEWMKLVAARIIKADFTEEEETQEDKFYSEAPKKTISVPLIPKVSKLEKQLEVAIRNKKWAEQRAYKEDIKLAKASLKVLLKEETISPKLSGLLKNVFTEDNLLTMDSSMRLLLATKMESFTASAALILIAILKKPYSLLRTDSLDLSDDLDLLDSPTPSEDPIMSEAQGACLGNGLGNSLEDNASCILPLSTIDTLASPASPKLSIIEKIKAAKAALSTTL